MFEVFKFLIVIVAFIENSESQTVPGACFCVTSGACNNGTGQPGQPGTGGDGTGQIVSMEI